MPSCGRGPQDRGNVMRSTRALITAAACFTALSMSMPGPAFAGEGGKSGDSGCSNPYTLGFYALDSGRLYLDAEHKSEEPRTEALVDSGAFETEALVALLQSIDHNADAELCFKLPNGWTEGNTSNRDGFVNLVDNKI